MTEEMRLRIDRIYDRWTHGISPGGQVLIRVKGEIVYDRCFGYADIENQRLITDETVFHVASVSKQFTVMGAMLLREEGRLDIDADVRTYIPEYIGFSEPVTVRDLMNNDTGIRDMFELADWSGTINTDALDQEYVLRLIAKQKGLNFQPRSHHTYSNSNFILLAAIVEKISGMPLRVFLEQRIFRPLDMRHTTVRDHNWMCLDNRSQSYQDDGSNYYYAPITYGIYGTTSLHSTAHDLMKWLENYRNPKICSEETIQIMTKAATLTSGEPNTYACGLREDYLEGHRYIKHAGEDAGFRTFVFRLMDDDIDIVKLANCDTVMSDPSTMAVARILLGLPEGAEPVLPVQSCFDEADAPGFYYGTDWVSGFAVERQKDGMYLRGRWGSAPLTHIRGNLYRAGHLDEWYLLGKDGAHYVNAEEFTRLKKSDDHPVERSLSSQLEGTYYCPELDCIYRVEWTQGRLYLDHIRHGKKALHPMDDGRFAVEWLRPTCVRFVWKDGAVVGMTFTGGRVSELQMNKLPEGVL